MHYFPINYAYLELVLAQQHMVCEANPAFTHTYFVFSEDMACGLVGPFAKRADAERHAVAAHLYSNTFHEVIASVTAKHIKTDVQHTPEEDRAYFIHACNSELVNEDPSQERKDILHRVLNLLGQS